MLEIALTISSVNPLPLLNIYSSSLRKEFEKLGIMSGCIIQSGDATNKFLRAISIIPNIKVIPEKGANVYDILKHTKLIIAKNAIEKLEERLA